MTRTVRWCSLLVFTSFALMAIAMLFHALPFVRQPDVQHIELAFRLMVHVRDGTLMDYLLAPQKYPLLPVMGLALLYGTTLITLWGVGVIPSLAQTDLMHYLFTGPTALNFVTRFSALAAGVTLLIFIAKASKKLFPDISSWYAVVLMMSSMVFLVLLTAMRLHVLEICLTFLAFYFSLQYATNKNIKNALLTFGFASVAFCVLQNGIFAFVFPVMAYLYEENVFVWKRLFHKQLLLLIAGSFFVCSLLGYPFLWKEIFVEHSLGLGLGNEDIGQTPLTTKGFTMFVHTLTQSEIFPLVFALVTLFQWKQGKRSLHPLFVGVLFYFVVYVFFFGFIDWATARYFLPLIPFLALLGAPALSDAKNIQLPFLLFLTLVLVKYASLGFIPDTYDKARDYLLEETEGVIATGEPYYFLGITPTQWSIDPPKSQSEKYFLSLDNDLPGARDIVPLSRLEEAEVAVLHRDVAKEYIPSEGWTLCKTVYSAPWMNSMFLWSEVEWPFYRIFRTNRLGTSLSIFCRNYD